MPQETNKVLVMSLIDSNQSSGRHLVKKEEYAATAIAQKGQIS